MKHLRRSQAENLLAQAERINNTMKWCAVGLADNEMIKGKTFTDINEVIAAVAVAVDFYNNRRPHMSIGMMTPTEASELSGERDMKWTSYRQMAIKSRDNADITEYPLPLPPCHGSPSGLRTPVNP